MLEQTMKPNPLMGFLRAKPAKPGQLYGVPSGSSAQISLATGLVLIALWFLVTEMGWVKPLFLPSPSAVWNKFIIASTEGVANSTLAEHTFASLSRVLGAFVLATLTAIPVGSWSLPNMPSPTATTPPTASGPISFAPVLTVCADIAVTSRRPVRHRPP